MKFIVFFVTAVLGLVLPTAIAQVPTIVFCADNQCENILDTTPVITYPNGCNIPVPIPNGALASQLIGFNGEIPLAGFFLDPDCQDEGTAIVDNEDSCFAFRADGKLLCAMMLC